MKKRMLGLVLVLAMALSLVACGEKEEGSTSVTPTKSEQVASNTEKKEEAAPVKEAAQLIWAGWSGEEDSTKGVIQGMIDGFNTQGGAQVSWVGWPWADTLQQLIIRNQGSEVLDVAQVDIGMFGSLSEMDILVDLNELLGKDYLESNYDAASLEVGQVNGKQLAMPWSIASIGMVYNPTLLKAVGYDNPPATIEEFEDCMEKLKQHDPEIIPYGVSTKDATMATDFQPWLWTFGASLLDANGTVTVNSDAASECITWYKGLLDKGYIQMNIARSDARTLFAQGKIAFYDDAVSCNGVAIKNGIDAEKLDDFIRPMSRPVLKAGDTPQAAMWGHLLVVFKKSANQKEVADFIKYVVGEDQSLKYLDSNGMLPVLKTAIDSDAVKNNTWASTWLGITSTGRKLEFALRSNGGELNNIVVEELQAVLVGGKEVSDAITSMETRLADGLE